MHCNFSRALLDLSVENTLFSILNWFYLTNENENKLIIIKISSVFRRDLFFPRDSLYSQQKKTWQPHEVSESPICSEMRRKYKEKLHSKNTHNRTPAAATAAAAHPYVCAGRVCVRACVPYCRTVYEPNNQSQFESETYIHWQSQNERSMFACLHIHGTQSTHSHNVQLKGWWNDESMSTVNQNDKNTTTKVHRTAPSHNGLPSRYS